MFELYVPTKVYWGREIVEETIKGLDLIKGNVLIVTTGRSLKQIGYVDELVAYIYDRKDVNNIYIYEGISQNPDLIEIRKCVDENRDRLVDIVIGFGGGSAIDASKAVAASLGMNEDIYSLWNGKVSIARTLPIIAIPTTAGTGSELSKAAILSDRRARRKGGIRGESMYPRVAIVDSKYTETVPCRITMETGFDVLAHAFESYISATASDYTKMLSMKAIQIVRDNLLLLKSNLSNYEARKQMSYASMIMGINLGNASTALPHRLQYPLGANIESSHGAGLAALYSAWIKNAFDIYPEIINEVYVVLFGKKANDGVEASGMMKDYIELLGLSSNLSRFGVDKELVEKMTHEVTGNLKNDPLSVVDDIIKKIYIESLDE